MKDATKKLLPALSGFFIMGFVDVVGISTSYVKQDFGLNDTLANLLPMMVFLWFAIFSLPTGMLMRKIGRKKTVLVSLLITTVAMFILPVYYTFSFALMAFALLGIGNTVLQVSLNPLLVDVVDKQKVTGMLTLGQFIKAISSFGGPVLASITAEMLGDWKLIFPVYAVTSLLSFLWLYFVPIEEQKETTAGNHAGNLKSLLKNRRLLVLFSIIVLIVGFEIGLMTAVPKYFLERCALPLERGGLGCSLYYAARTVGTFIGSLLLMRIEPRRFLFVILSAAIFAFALFMVFTNVWILMVCLFIIGLGCANVFAIVFSTAIQSEPSKTNEISALMIMGVAGGALIPPVMGKIADATNQWTSLFVLLAILIYILTTTIYGHTQIKKEL